MRSELTLIERMILTEILQSFDLTSEASVKELLKSLDKNESMCFLGVMKFFTSGKRL